VDFFQTTIVVNCGGHVLEQNENFTESDWSKKTHDHPYSLLFSFYQLKKGSIVAPSESMKFPMTFFFCFFLPLKTVEFTFFTTRSANVSLKHHENTQKPQKRVNRGKSIF